MSPWPIEEVWLRPAATLVLSVLLPFVTAAMLRFVLFARPSEEPEARARQLYPLRTASLIAGFAQIEIAFVAGQSALGPALVTDPESARRLAFGALCAVIAFVAGGIARRAEELQAQRSSVLGTALLRLRFVAVFAGPMLAAGVAAELPLTDEGRIVWPFVALAFVLCAFGVAYATLVLGLATGALRLAAPPIRALAKDVARTERTSLWLVLRLPTTGTSFANAAAVPWARTMIVSDGIVDLLEPDELRAVLAHEAGHLSEPAGVALARVGMASAAIFMLAAGASIATELGAGVACALTIALLPALVIVVLVRRLARRMEVRADERARATVGAEPLARALTKLHRAMLLPMSTGAKRRVHPDLYDRLQACGVDPGERPPPPRRRMGILAGLAVGAIVVTGAFGAWTVTAIEDPTSASAGAARWRLRIDPWDAGAMIASGYDARRNHRYELAIARAREAARMGAAPELALELEAEALAARGDCVRARRAFDRAIEARAARSFEGVLTAPLTLGGYHIPPSLITECGGIDLLPAPSEALGPP